MTFEPVADGAGLGSIRERLRTSTSALHEQVDDHMRRLLGKTASGYGRFLLQSASAIVPLEAALEAGNVTTLLPDWSQRSRSLALQADLAALLLPSPPARPLELPRDEAFQFGVLYVLEGSRLGARLLLRELGVTLGPALKPAMSYLSHGNEQPLWRTFLQRLDASTAAKRRPERAVEGARQAFAMFLPDDQAVSQG